MAEPLTPSPAQEHPLPEVGAELDRLLRAGETRAVEAVLAAFPAQAADADSALQLIYDELVGRESLGEQPAYEEYYQRFPHWHEELRKTFDIHETLVRRGSEQSVSSPEEQPVSRRYELLEEIGSGGMGVVYRARQPGLDRIVALKMILEGEWAAPEDKARFRREAETAARLQHPNIVQVYEVGEQDGLPFLAMEYVEGGSLAERLQGTPLAALDSARLVETLAQAVHFAHERGVVHRDLKPANVLLNGDGVPKIADFGLAKRVAVGTGGDTPASHSQTGAIVGTPSYMAPEQTGGSESKRVEATGPAADVWALGVILYEVLTGRPPFHGETALETLFQVRQHEPVPPRQLQPHLPRDLETICLKCLRKEASKRYASAAELADDLRRFTAGETIRARPVGPLERTAKWVRRRPAVAGLLVAVVGVTVTGVVALAWQLQVTREALEQAQVRQAERDLALAESLWRDNDVPRSRELLLTVPPPYRTPAWHDLHRACFAELHRLNLVQSCAVLVWSTDSSRLIAVVAGKVTVWDGETGHVVHEIVIPYARAGYTSALNGEDLSLICQTGFRPVPRGTQPEKPMEPWKLHLTHVDLRTGKVADTLLPEEWLGARVVLSPSGRRLAISKPSRDPAFANVLVMDAATAQLVRSLVKPEGVVSPSHLHFSPDENSLASPEMYNNIITWDDKSDLPMTIPWTDHRALIGSRRSPDGNLLACYGYVPSSPKRGQIWIWDLKQQRIVRQLGRPSVESVACIAFSPDGRYVAWEGDHSAIFLSEISTGKEVFWLRGHRGPIYKLAFSPDGRRLASYSSDATVRIWNVAD